MIHFDILILILTLDLGLLEMSKLHLILHCCQARLFIQLVLYCVIFKRLVCCRLKVICERLQWTLKVVTITNLHSIFFIKFIVVRKNMRQVLIISLHIFIGTLWGQNHASLNFHELSRYFCVLQRKYRESLTVLNKAVHLELTSEELLAKESKEEILRGQIGVQI